jgi:hypothetical protein
LLVMPEEVREDRFFVPGGGENSDVHILRSF